ncbi:hypothetical protein B0H16DRAFT_1840441 [Mycena metata]|uniref:Uncharacterized protein n=1 Tax=Mycena metata TaxID=1033252 RepID=A0AAD7GLX3_9AGAR|nr:hypothetical protein B0H16DRAFT_1840441 [Mycena metata]
MQEEIKPPDFMLSRSFTRLELPLLSTLARIDLLTEITFPHSHPHLKLSTATLGTPISLHLVPRLQTLIIPPPSCRPSPALSLVARSRVRRRTHPHTALPALSSRVRGNGMYLVCTRRVPAPLPVSTLILILTYPTISLVLPRARARTHAARTQTVEVECRLAAHAHAVRGVRGKSHPIRHLPISPPRLHLPTLALIVAALTYTAAASHRRIESSANGSKLALGGDAAHAHVHVVCVRVESPHSSPSPSSSHSTLSLVPRHTARAVESRADCTTHAHAVRVRAHRVPARLRRVHCVRRRRVPAYIAAMCAGRVCSARGLVTVPVRFAARRLRAGSSAISRHIHNPLLPLPFRSSLQLRTSPPHVPP